MSGTEVIANYLANIALQGNYYYTDEIIERYSAQEIFDMVMNSYTENTILIQQYYDFTNQEFSAYKLYSKITMICGYCNQYVFSECIKNKKYKDKIIELLYLIHDVRL